MAVPSNKKNHVKQPESGNSKPSEGRWWEELWIYDQLGHILPALTSGVMSLVPSKCWWYTTDGDCASGSDDDEEHDLVNDDVGYYQWHVYRF